LKALSASSQPDQLEMPSTTRAQQNSRISPPANVRLVNWPVRDDGAHAWTFVALVVAVAVGFGFVARSTGVGLLSLAAMSLAMWRMWVPVVFEFGPRGIHQRVFRTKRRIAWSVVKRCTVRKRGVTLLFFEDSSPLADALGLYIRWGKNKEELLDMIRYYTGSRILEHPSSTVSENN